MEDNNNTLTINNLFSTPISISNITNTLVEVINSSVIGITEVYSRTESLDNGNVSTQNYNLSKIGNGTLPISKAPTNKPCTTTLDPFDEFGPPEGVEYIFVPLGVMIFVILLSAVVLIVSRKRKLERLRHRLMPLYNFDPGEEGEDDWETELLDEGFNSRQRRQVYRSMDSADNVELFSGK